MGQVLFWSNVQVAIQSAIAAAKTITAISKASPGVVSSTAHGYANGDYVLLEVSGMSQVDKRVFRVAGVAADSFQLEGEDTTTYSTFTSGTVKKLTLGTTMSTVQTVSVSGGDADMKEISTIHDNVKRRVPLMVSPMSLGMTSFFDPSDAALTLLRTATKELTMRAFLFTFATGAKMVFNAYVSAAGVPIGNAQDAVQTQITLEAQGLPSTYAS